MRIFSYIVLARFAVSQLTPATSGWEINCQVATGVNGSGHGGYYAAQSANERHIELFYGLDNRGDPTIGGQRIGPAEGSNGLCGVPETDEGATIVEPGLFTWPNQVSPVPQEVYKTKGYFLVADGAAGVNTHDGCIAIVNTNGWDEQTPIDVASENIVFITHGCGQGNFLQTKQYYTFAQWMDVDQDGELDIVTARASSLTDADDPSESGMVWVQNPGCFSINPLARWEVFDIPITSGIADSAFDIMTYEGVTYAIAGSYAGAGLYLFSGADWTDSSSMSSTPIELGGRHYFSTMFHDLNLDGIPDALVTLQSDDDQSGQLIIYPGEIDNNGSYSLQGNVTVSTEFPVYNNGGIGSPGRAIPFYYNTDDEQNGEIPSLLVSGDDDGFLYVFDPARGPKFTWEYSRAKTIFETKRFSPLVTPVNAPVVGYPLVIDLNDDGCYEIVVPATSVNVLMVLEQTNCSVGPDPSPTAAPLSAGA